MKKYPTYKESGIQWIGEIPEHWELKCLKFWVKLRNEKVSNTSPLDFKVALENIEKETGKLILGNGSFEGFGNAFKAGDILFNKLRPYLTKVYEAEKEGVAVSELLVLEPQNCVGAFLKYRLLSKDFIDIVDSSTYGAKMPRANWNFIGNINLPYPPYAEQASIASFLLRKTSEIDQLIATKEELIQKLEVQRKALINEAVTGQAYKNGLIPFSTGKVLKYKVSNIEWLREIPEHWNVERLKYLSSITTGNKDTENKEDDGIFPFFVRSQKVERISTYSFEGEAILTAGDGVGVCKVWHYVNEKFDFHQRVYMLYNFKKIKGLLLFYYLRENFIHDVLKRSAKSTVDSLRRPMFQNFPVAYPPSVEEQNTIINFIEDIDKTFTDLIEMESTTISKLKDYKQSLISEAVTGKIDVREWQKDETNKIKNF